MMLTSKTMLLYRAIALLVLSIPTVINLYIQGSIVSAIIYVPVITLALSGIAIFIDGKLEALLTKCTLAPKLAVATTEVAPITTKNIMTYKLFIKPNTLASNVVQLPSNATDYKAVGT